MECRILRMVLDEKAMTTETDEQLVDRVRGYLSDSLTRVSALACVPELCNRLLAASEARKMQPMETVPKDGNPVLVLLCEPMLNSVMHVGTFHPNVSCIGGHFEFDCPKAIGWMPLPEAKP